MIGHLWQDSILAKYDVDFFSKHCYVFGKYTSDMAQDMGWY